MPAKIKIINIDEAAFKRAAESVEREWQAGEGVLRL